MFRIELPAVFSGAKRAGLFCNSCRAARNTQARHRVIIVGVREDLAAICPEPLQVLDPVPLEMVIKDLPRIRSGISRTQDSVGHWLEVIRQASDRRWLQTARRREPHIADQMESALARIRAPKADRGAEFLPHKSSPAYKPEWYEDQRIGGICNHQKPNSYAERSLSLFLCCLLCKG